MIRTPHGTLALAASLAAMSVAELRDLLRRRQLVSLRQVRDPLSLAAELLRPESVLSALRRLSRAEIVTLRRVEAADRGAELTEEDRETIASLRRFGLVGQGPLPDSITSLPEVAAALDEFEDRGIALPSENDRPPSFPATTAETDDEASTARWFGSALASASTTAALLRTLAQQPARLSRRGSITVIALRELAAATHDHPDRTARLVTVLEHAGLTGQFTGQSATPLLWPAPAAAEWLALPAPERWAVLAAAHTEALSPELRRTLELSDSDLEHAAGPLLEREFPLLPDTARTDAREWTETAELLGLAVHRRLTPAAIRLLAGDVETARAIAREDFPATAPGIYVQPDLSIVVPGPLSPGDEQDLTAIADTEQLGAAVTMRLSPASLTRALRAGRRIYEIRKVLERLSLTGIPQPLDYLLGDLERKGVAGEPVPSPTRRLERFVAAPQAAAVGLREERAVAEKHSELDRVAELVYETAQQHSSAGELTRQLELAIRERSAVRVTAVGGREERTFLLLPVSLTAGRLRATDQTAGVERTLPVSAITAVEAA